MKKEATALPEFISLRGITASVFILLYLLVDFIPLSKSFDIIGPQWFYAAVIDLLGIAYILFSTTYKDNEHVSRFLRSPQTICYLIFILFAAASVFAAVNKVEFLVCFTRLVITVGALFNLCIFLQDERGFRFLFQAIGLFALFQSLEAIKIFFDTVSEVGLDNAILNMKTNAGNKNIFAAGLVIKTPFVLYCIYAFKGPGRWLNFALLAIILYCLFLVNARSSYVGFGSVLIVFVAFLGHKGFQEKKIKEFVQISGTLILTIALGIFLSTKTIEQKRNEFGGGAYGTVSERFQTIALTNSSSSQRFNLWQESLQLIQQNPLRGIGYGNWKLASIPLEKYITDDYLIYVHSHNDFLEMFAELGIVGGLSYFLLFVLTAIISLRNLFRRSANAEKKFLLMLTVAGIAGYGVDALLNFPMERTTMQIYFAFLLALNIMLNVELSGGPGFRRLFVKPVFAVLMILMIPAIWISYSTYQSMIVQAETQADVKLDVPVLNWQEVNDRFPSIPNLTQVGLPIDGIKARYLLKAGRYDEALPLLDKAIEANPYNMYGELLKGFTYNILKEKDSAYKYAAKAFANRPRAYAHYKLVAEVSRVYNDTNFIRSAFYEYVKYNPTSKTWNDYLFTLTKTNTPIARLRTIADSALLLFPKDSLALNNKKAIDQMQMQNIGGPILPIAGGTPVQRFDLPASPEVSAAHDNGRRLFDNKEYAAAIEQFRKALKIQPQYYPAAENIGMSYYMQNNFAEALPYFKKVINNRWSTDGKSEFFAGICLISIGRKEEGCRSLRAAKKKNYFDAQRLIDLNCK